MKPVSLYNDIASTSYPGRGIVIGKSADGSKAVIAYFIMGRSETAETECLQKPRTASKLRLLIRQSLLIRHLSSILRKSSRQQNYRY